MEGFLYYCPTKCPIKKHCFVLKTESELHEPIVVLKKCTAENGKDIRIKIGEEGNGEHPP